MASILVRIKINLCTGETTGISVASSLGANDVGLHSNVKPYGKYITLRTNLPSLYGLVIYYLPRELGTARDRRDLIIAG